jgi:alkyl hydroperoxide reductase subunit F
MLREPIELVASLGDDAKSAQTRELLRKSPRCPTRSRALRWRQRARPLHHQPRRRAQPRVRFAGLPMGHEFTSLVLALLWAGGHPPKVARALDQIADLPGD